MTRSQQRRQLTSSGFGIEITGIDLAARDKSIHSALIDEYHTSGGLLLIKGQDPISPETLREFVAAFGDLERNEKYDRAFLHPDHPEILRIGNTRKNGSYTALYIEADPLPLLWHTDDSFRDPQPAGSCLCCLRTPPEGGETGFAGMTSAYDSLSSEMSARVDRLSAVHSYNHLNELLRIKNPHRPALSESIRRQFPPIGRPLVAIHPVTGRRSLYIPQCHIESIDGLEQAETQSLLSNLMDLATRTESTYMHRWERGDVVIWDNRCTLHAPNPFDAEKHERLMYRLTFAGEQIRTD